MIDTSPVRIVFSLVALGLYAYVVMPWIARQARALAGRSGGLDWSAEKKAWWVLSQACLRFPFDLVIAVSIIWFWPDDHDGPRRRKARGKLKEWATKAREWSRPVGWQPRADHV